MVLSGVVVALGDLLNMGRGLEWWSQFDVLVTTTVAVVAAISSVGLLLGWLRLALRGTRPTRWRAALVAMLETAAILRLVLWTQRYAKFELQGGSRILVAVLVLVGAGALGWFVHQRPRVTRGICLFGAVGAFLGSLFAGRGWIWTNLALWLVLLVALGGWLSGLGRRQFARPLAFGVSTLCTLGVAIAVLLGNVQVRGLVLQRSRVAGDLMQAVARSRWGSRSGTAHRSLPCDDYPAAQIFSARTSLSASARDADVLLISIEALRWDHRDALPQLHRALGPQVRFTRAVSPAPNTKHSIPAVLRGVPAREIPFGEEILHQGARPDAPATLAIPLVDEGYRAVTVPSHFYLNPRANLAAGFETIKADETRVFRDGSGKPTSFVLFRALVPKALEVAASTQEPLLLWLHVMDTHAPYPYPAGRGPITKAGQRRALDALDEPLTRFLAAFRRARGDRSLVVVIFGDHGEEFSEHGGLYHGRTVFAEQVRVLFTLAYSGLPSKTIDSPVSTAAIATTLLDLLGMPQPQSMTIPSLLPCIAGLDCPRLAESQQMKQDGWVSYTGQRVRLVYNPRYAVEYGFDTQNDPYDQRPLLGSRSSLGPALAELRRLVERYDSDHCAAAPLTDE